jgi:hypothetical protein
MKKQKKQFTQKQKKSIKGPKACLICGWNQSFVDAAHIIDEIAKPAANGVYLCPNCHRAFDNLLRPRLHKALVAFGVDDKQLPKSWIENTDNCSVSAL